MHACIHDMRIFLLCETNIPPAEAEAEAESEESEEEEEDEEEAVVAAGSSRYRLYCFPPW
jgi:CO dehydrogenase/acetyl-CoA synthase beta subunit